MLLVLLALSFQDLQAHSHNYVRKQVAEARFGAAYARSLLKNIHGLKPNLSPIIAGQDALLEAVQDRLTQYIEHYGTRRKEPIALHLIGLPGVGKTALLEAIEGLNIACIKIDAQHFSQKSEHVLAQLYQILRRIEIMQKRGPVILMADEIDKVSEPENSSKKDADQANPKTNHFMSILNEILTDGKVITTDAKTETIHLHNVFVLTAMNFSPEEIQRFSKAALKEEKNFYDFTLEDFEKFDQWIRSEKSAIPKVLARLFRENSVSRIAPNAIIVKALSRDAYKKIIAKEIKDTLSEATSNIEKKISATFSKNLVDFFFPIAVNPPLGARPTISKVDALTAQLVYFGTKATAPGDKSLDRPRKIHLEHASSENMVRVRVTPLLQKRGKLVDGNPFDFLVEYNPESGLFKVPEFIAVDPPSARKRVKKAKTKKEVDFLTQKDLRDNRFPSNVNYFKGLAKRISKELFGLGDLPEILEKELSAYSAKEGPSNARRYMVLAGAPGVGKTKVVLLAGEHGSFPVARVNMQQFISNTAETMTLFYNALAAACREAEKKSSDGKYILLIEELDKVSEIDPATGEGDPLPVMAIIKDLLDKGLINGPQGETLDLREAFPIITMNFGIDRFGFIADPRLTTVADTLDAWKKISVRLADRKKLLDSMFLPETVDRLLDRLYILKPFSEAHFRKIIRQQIQEHWESRLDEETGKDLARIEFDFTPAYRKYLYDQTAIPSQNARNLISGVWRILDRDVEEAIRAIPRTSPYAVIPLRLHFDYLPKSSTVISTMHDARKKKLLPPLEISRKEVALTFPPLDIKGKISEERLTIGIHEFGHAYAGVRFGKRFEFATAVSPMTGIGGYVKFNEKNCSTARGRLVRIYSLLAARALEKIFLCKDPAQTNSCLEVTDGAVADITLATNELWKFFYQFGFDPQYGIVSRSGYNGERFPELTHAQTEAFARILQSMQDYLVKDFLNAHPREWYQKKILKFAKSGGLKEKHFYDLIAYPYPGDNQYATGELSPLRALFPGKIKELPQEVKTSMEFKQGNSKTTAIENMDAAAAYFLNSVSENLHELEGFDQLFLKKQLQPKKSKSRRKPCADSIAGSNHKN